MAQQYGQFLVSSHLYGSNASYIEALYEAYLENPGSVAPRWRAYFDQLQSGKESVTSAPIQESKTAKGMAVAGLIYAYRTRGVLRADLDPLNIDLLRKHDAPELELAYHGLSEADLGLTVDTTATQFGPQSMTLESLIAALKETYCGTFSAEYMYIRDVNIKHWLIERIESVRAKPVFDAAKKKRLLDRLNAAEGLENYLNTRFVGVKRFSLYGGEAFIAALDTLVRYAAAKGVDDIALGMAHRGRLNTLVNIMGKEPAALFAEFDHTAPETLISGDVKYHNGFSNTVQTPSGPVHLTMPFNPSHLEAVSPVLMGSARARIDRRKDTKGTTVLPVIVHGDGAVIAQGIVQETMNMSGVRGYMVGGAIRIVINNQIQFTTSDPRDVRTSLYCTDIARMIDAPVFHANGDDPEAVAFAVELALDYRQEFHRDVVIDLMCYRKLGHNEQDTPEITQPFMYRAVKGHPSVRRLYAQRLIDEKIIDASYEENLQQAYRQAMEMNEITSDPVLKKYQSPYATDWKPYIGKNWSEPSETGVALKKLQKYAKTIASVPENVLPHPLSQKVLKDRAAMGRGELPLDWGMAENLAYASIVDAGIPVRLSGEDCGRGTFGHRQAMIHNQNRASRLEDPYIALQHIGAKQGCFTIVDSVLSEYGVLGFEYGYSTACPQGLTLWEAQFGDFANVAQVIIDQYVAASESKWDWHSGLVLLLPHGYEGQGPEHSSARIERFLGLSAQENWVLAQPTTAAQIFHLLRSHALSEYRKPLVIFTPKSLLRSKNAASSLEEFTQGHFQMVLPEAVSTIQAKKVRRVILCSGKVYYDLVQMREEKQRHDVAILRMEQLYPFPQKLLAAELKKYSSATDIVWCQDEPENQGAWHYMQAILTKMSSARQQLGFAGRPASSAPATGYSKKHLAQLKQLLEHAFAPINND